MILRIMDNNNSVLFSVLIANYNNGLYLEEAINSVKAQTYQNWEIIIVDDCSKDNSISIYNKYKTDSHIHIYYNDSNHGCGYTKRRCVELAQGEICGFLDPDDTLLPVALEVMVDTHKKNDSVSLVYSRNNVCDANMNVIHISTQQKEYPDNGSFSHGDHFASFKTDLYRKTIGINPEFLRAVDHDLYFKMEEIGRFLFVDKVLYNYRTNTGSNISLSENADKAYLWHLVATIDTCRRRGLPIEDIAFKEFSLWAEKNVNKGKTCAYDEITRTITFRAGYLVLCPIRIIKRFFNYIGLV